MTESLTGSVALVTGASGGIGEAIAVRLASLGARVALAARSKDQLERVAEAINANGGTAVVIQADLSNAEQARRAVERAVLEADGLDIVVNNAGMLLLGPIVDAPLDEWDQMVRLNLMGVMHVAHAALPHLIRAAQDGRRGVADLVNISSIAGRIATRNTGVYNATKFALSGFSESLRQEVGERYVRVSVIEPGYVATRFAMGSRREVLQQLAGSFDPGQPLQPDSVADAVSYVVTRPRGLAINEMVIRGTEQVR
jgi:NADP-dependent 3-hydroxy acid dehydrogenase YdfG